MLADKICDGPENSGDGICLDERQVERRTFCLKGLENPFKQHLWGIIKETSMSR